LDFTAGTNLKRSPEVCDLTTTCDDPDFQPFKRTRGTSDAVQTTTITRSPSEWCAAYEMQMAQHAHGRGLQTTNGLTHGQFCVALVEHIKRLGGPLAETLAQKMPPDALRAQEWLIEFQMRLQESLARLKRDSKDAFRVKDARIAQLEARVIELEAELAKLRRDSKDAFCVKDARIAQLEAKVIEGQKEGQKWQKQFWTSREHYAAWERTCNDALRAKDKQIAQLALLASSHPPRDAKVAECKQHFEAEMRAARFSITQLEAKLTNAQQQIAAGGKCHEYAKTQSDALRAKVQAGLEREAQAKAALTAEQCVSAGLRQQLAAMDQMHGPRQLPHASATVTRSDNVDDPRNATVLDFCRKHELMEYEENFRAAGLTVVYDLLDAARGKTERYAAILSKMPIANRKRLERQLAKVSMQHILILD
jgi:hypothetical protein